MDVMKSVQAAILAAMLACSASAPVHAVSVGTPQEQSGKASGKSKGRASSEGLTDKIMRFFTGKKKPAEKRSERHFIDGYRQAYALVYERQDYGAAIGILRALGRDDHPDVANLIGFASRKLGRTEDARVWYEKALAADARHTRTLQYYGIWHLERGDRRKAEQHLKAIAGICGTDCEDYRSLNLALAGDGFVY
jgi:tetratricopeptide (TPR) repeat protein